MSNNDPNTKAEQHTGYDFESGVLERVREWVDVFPWIRLGRTLRIAGSPPMLMLVAFGLAIWSFGMNLLGPANLVEPSISSEGIPFYQGPEYLADLFFVSIISRWGSPFAVSDLLNQLVRFGWTMLVWLPVALFLLRQGALLTSARPLMGFMPTIRLSLDRSPKSALLSIVPMLCIAVIAASIVVAGWISRIANFLDPATSLIVALVAIPCGVLAFGAYVAVPIGWAAMINEERPDPLDSLSRGYEYLYRRPLSCVLYAMVSAIILSVAVLLALGVSIAGQQVVGMALGVAGSSESVETSAIGILQALPQVVGIAMFWGLIGGSYLLLRKDAGGQEVEDIWRPPSPSLVPLPELKTQSSPSSPTESTMSSSSTPADSEATSSQIDNLDQEKLVEVATRPTETEATILVSVLKDAGIKAVAMGGFTAGFRAEAPGWVSVKTFEKDAQRAKQVLSELKMHPAEWPDEDVD